MFQDIVNFRLNKILNEEKKINIKSKDIIAYMYTWKKYNKEILHIFKHVLIM